MTLKESLQILVRIKQLVSPMTNWRNPPQAQPETRFSIHSGIHRIYTASIRIQKSESLRIASGEDNEPAVDHWISDREQDPIRIGFF